MVCSARFEGLERAAACLLAFAGCGGGERQDENEPEGNFAVEVVEAKFPEDQKLAKSSDLVVTVRNAGEETIPNIAMTVNGFDKRKKNPDLADPNRPVFALNGVQVEIAGFPEAKDAAPRGCDTAYVDTWACGPLSPGQQKTFRWSVTAVKAGEFEVRLARGRRPRRQGQGRGGRRRPGAARQRSPARSPTPRPTSAWRTTARPSSAGLADLAFS